MENSILQFTSYTVGESKLMQSQWKTAWRVLKKTINRVATDPAIPLLSHAMKYYSVIKNETMPFAATQMDPEMIKLNHVSQKKKGK